MTGRGPTDPVELRRRALHRIRRERFATRAHVRARLATAPLAAVVDAVSPATAVGLVVDVGCGHGVVSWALADAGCGPVLGVDLDPAKVAVARRSAAAEPTVSDVDFDVVDAGWMPPSEAAVVVFVDVLYLLPAAEQEAIVRAAAAAVGPGGRVVVKETDDRPAWKRRWTSTQEALAVRTITRRAARTTTPPTSAQVTAWLDAAGLATTVERLDRHRPWPHYLVIGEREVDGPT